MGSVSTKHGVILQSECSNWKRQDYAITSASGIANLTPLRYRGYYYDNESGFYYYLQSRYYDPSICRFINADSLISQDLDGGLNLFAYCGNNPVCNYDPTGHSFLGALIVSAIAFTVGIVVAAVSTAVYENQRQKKSQTYPVAKPASNTQAQVKSDNASNYTVYKLIDDSQNVQYVGRTKNVEARKTAHANSPARGDLSFEVIASDLTYQAARGMEQAYMLHYHTINRNNAMNNQINGISPKNSKIQIYIDSAAAYLENQITNELMSWAGI